MNKTIKGFIIGLIVGVFVMLTTTSLANTIKEYMLVNVSYPILINEVVYESEELPVLNHQGHTYVPLRAISDLLSSGIHWNEELRQVEITNGIQPQQNEAFRSIIVSGSNGTYTIAGEARVFEATVQYEVEDGHIIFDEGFVTASTGGPEWGIFKIDIQIPEESLPEFGTISIILYSESAEDGSRLHELAVPLENFNETE